MFRNIEELLSAVKARDRQRVDLAECVGRPVKAVIPVGTIVEVNGESVRLLTAVQVEYVQKA